MSLALTGDLDRDDDSGGFPVLPHRCPPGRSAASRLGLAVGARENGLTAVHRIIGPPLTVRTVTDGIGWFPLSH